MQKKIFLFIIIAALDLLSSASAQSPTPPYYDSTKNLSVVNATGNHVKEFRVAGAIWLPQDTFHLAVKDSGALAWKNGRVFKYTGYRWADFSSGIYWELGGNTSTDTSINFLGPIDVGQLQFRAGNEKMGWLDATNDNVSFGYHVYQPSGTSADNIALGGTALQAMNDGYNNIGIGQNALKGLHDGLRNIAIGKDAGLANVSGSDNVAIGNYALKYFHDSTGYIGIGLFDNGSAAGDVTNTPILIKQDANPALTDIRFNGKIQAMLLPQSSSTGDSVMVKETGTGLIKTRAQSAISANAWSITGNSGTTAGTNFIGTTDATDFIFKRNNIWSGRIGNSNTSFGKTALDSVTTGANNNAFGVSSLAANTSANSNNAFGNGSLIVNTTGATNSAFGNGSLSGITTGSLNNGFGSGTLLNITSANYNTAIGSGASPISNRTNTITIGYSAKTGCDSCASYGDTSANIKHGFGTAYPTTRIDIRGQLKVKDGTEAAGNVFVSDANGIGSWVSQSTIVSGNTWQQTLDNGSVLNKNNSIDGGNHEFDFTNFSVAQIVANNYINLAATHTALLIRPDSIYMVANGKLTINDLANNLGTKSVRYNPLTGLVSYADTTSGGSISAPNTEILFGTGSGVTSSSTLTFDGNIFGVTGIISNSNTVSLGTGVSASISHSGTKQLDLGDPFGNGNSTVLSINDNGKQITSDGPSHDLLFGINTNAGANLDVVGTVQFYEPTNGIGLNIDGGQWQVGDGNGNAFAFITGSVSSKDLTVGIDGGALGIRMNPVDGLIAIGYGLGSRTGIPAYSAQFDASGNIIEGRVSAGIVSSADSTAKTATDTNVTSYTVGASDGSFIVSASLDITSVAAGVLTTTVNWTDVHSNSRTGTFYGMGTTTAGIGALGSSNFAPMGEIRAKAGTTITVVETLTVGTATYDISATIQQLR